MYRPATLLPHSLVLLVATLAPTRAAAAAQSVNAPASAPARAPARAPSCQSPAYRQFDFWIGRWEVRGPAGRVAGTNHVERVLGGCALVEHWAGARQGSGTSLNFYDAADGRWHQTWVDNEGQPLYLSGGLRDGRMVLEGVTRGTDGRATRQRITWTPLAGGDVRQLWESSTDDGATWSVVFDGRYIRRAGS